MKLQRHFFNHPILNSIVVSDLKITLSKACWSFNADLPPIIRQNYSFVLKMFLQDFATKKKLLGIKADGDDKGDFGSACSKGLQTANRFPPELETFKSFLKQYFSLKKWKPRGYENGILFREILKTTQRISEVGKHNLCCKCDSYSCNSVEGCGSPTVSVSVFIGLTCCKTSRRERNEENESCSDWLR